MTHMIRLLAGLSLPLLVGFLWFCAVAQAQTGGEAFTGFRTDNDQPIKIEADSLEVRDSQKMAVFKGNVDVQQGETTMKAARLNVFYEGQVRTGGAQSNQGIRKIEARGKVLVTSGNNTATGDKADFDMRTQVVVLSGNVVLSQCDNIIVGESLTVNLKNGQAQLSAAKRQNGRVTALFSPNQPTEQQQSTCE